MIQAWQMVITLIGEHLRAVNMSHLLKRNTCNSSDASIRRGKEVHRLRDSTNVHLPMDPLDHREGLQDSTKAVRLQQ
jgi:hypothetical protein